MATIAWLGTGLLGTGFVKAALARGDTVQVWNRTPSKAEALRGAGALVKPTPVEAARGAERVHLCLKDDESVDAVLEQLVATPGFKGPVVDHTTVSPDGASRRAQRLQARGVDFLACPVFMGPQNAAEATGRMLCAGPPSLVERLSPALRAMTGELLPLGDDVRTPYTYKLIGNALIIGLTGLMADTLALAQGSTLSPDEVLRFVSAFPLSNILAGRGARMVRGDYAAAFELSMARKDVRLMQELAHGQPLAMLDGLAARIDALLAQGLGAKDLGVLALESVPERR